MHRVRNLVTLLALVGLALPYVIRDSKNEYLEKAKSLLEQNMLVDGYLYLYIPIFLLNTYIINIYMYLNF